MALNCDLKSGRLSASLPHAGVIARVRRGYAAAHPDVVTAVGAIGRQRLGCTRLAIAIERVAEAC